MNRITDVLKLADDVQKSNGDAVLATVVRTEGSAYRHAGAMMLICADGRSVGMISGGCLEPHIIKRAFWLTRNGANVQVYQTGDEVEYNKNGQAIAKPYAINDEASAIDEKQDWHHPDESDDSDELNFGLGCNGRVHVLFERLATALPLLKAIKHVRDTQRPLTVATLVNSGAHKHDGPALKIGMRFDIDEFARSGQPTALRGQQDLLSLIPDVSAAFMNPMKILTAYQLDKKHTAYVSTQHDVKANLTQKAAQPLGQTDWLIQCLQPQNRLLICGAGNDVMPLVTMAKLQDWHVTVIDSRAQYATRLRFPEADEVMCVPLHDADTLLKLSRHAAIALMSHSLSQDRARLATLLTHSSDYKYIGQLGPCYRTERLIAEIKAATTTPDALTAGIAQLYYPIGYKLGGDGPEALALGIMAQISAVLHGQTSAMAPLNNALDANAMGVA